jgi:hypothetical protein
MGFFDIGAIAKGVMEGVIGPLFGWLNKKEDVSLEKFKVNGQVDMTLVNAYRAEMALKAELVKDRRKTRAGRIEEYLFVYPLGVWWGAVILYCIIKPWVPWWKPVLALPEGQFMTWAGWMVAAIFAVSKLDGWIRKT